MSQGDHIPGSTPGLGCGCRLCKEPLAEPEIQSEAEAARRQAKYRDGRGYPDRDIPQPPKRHLRL